MNRYVKGARGERELLGKFHELGYSVIRSAGSGVNSISPDIIAIKNGLGFAFECKAWDKDRLDIEKEKHKVLVDWQENTKLRTFVAWRMNGKGWFFIKPEEFKEGGKNYGITKKIVLNINRRFDAILSPEERSVEEPVKDAIHEELINKQ